MVATEETQQQQQDVAVENGQLPEYVAIPVDEIQGVVEAVRAGFRTGITRDLGYRKQQLRQMALLIEENKELLAAAVHRDLHKSKNEFALGEISNTQTEIATALDNLDKWAKPVSPSKDLLTAMDKIMVRKEPKGVRQVLVMGAWNYPLVLALPPLINAMAAGNAVVLKPSEVSAHTAALLADLIPRYLDPMVYRVINGGIPETTELLKIQFDHILYTGSTSVGKIVMQAAAKHLTPVTLELGGRCPVIVADDVDVEAAANRIAWGKFMNCGQTCVAPNYLLCSPEMQDKLAAALQNTITRFYGEDPQKATDFGRIVNERHFDRVRKLLEHAKKRSDTPQEEEGSSVPADKVSADKYSGDLVFGGQVDADDKYIAPSIITNVGWDSDIMGDEIFGPLLLLVPIENVKERAVELIATRDHPLALYIFAKDKDFVNYVLDNTQSGSVCVNDTMMQLKSPGVPFGGVGASGMGHYLNKWGFDTFSHMRTTVVRSLGLESVNQVKYPPYSDKVMGYLDRFVFKKP
ncbi:hypothetical protein RI367_001965 [Sorochytrium milnesiophthora]